MENPWLNRVSAAMTEKSSPAIARIVLLPRNEGGNINIHACTVKLLKIIIIIIIITITIIIIIGALGAIKKGLEAYLGRIPGQLSISELQKITLLGTAHILRRVLSI